MKLNIFNKLKHLVKDSKKLYIITNSTAYKELKLNGVLSNKIYCCIFVGEYFDSKSNKSLSNFTLPLSSIRFRPYSLKAKIQVLYCDFLQLIICLLFKLLKGKNIEIIFTSIMNSRSLYILDSFIKNRLPNKKGAIKIIIVLWFKKNTFCLIKKNIAITMTSVDVTNKERIAIKPVPTIGGIAEILPDMCNTKLVRNTTLNATV